MQTVTCTKCDKPKPLTEFYVYPPKPPQKRCKVCTRAATEARRQERLANDPEGLQAEKNAWKKTPAGREASRRQNKSEAGRNRVQRYRTTDKGRAAAARYYRKHKSRGAMMGKAHKAVHTALRNGNLVQGPCTQAHHNKCKGRIEGHHWSYLKEHWLDVIWMCVKHHEAEHYRIAELGHSHT